MKLNIESPRVKAAVRELAEAVAELNPDMAGQYLPTDVASLQRELNNHRVCVENLRKQLDMRDICNNHLRETINCLESQLAAERKRVAELQQGTTAITNFNLDKEELDKLNANHVGETRPLPKTDDDFRIESAVQLRTARIAVGNLTRHIQKEVEYFDKVTDFEYNLTSSIGISASRIQQYMDALYENGERWKKHFAEKNKS